MHYIDKGAKQPVNNTSVDAQQLLHRTIIPLLIKVKVHVSCFLDHCRFLRSHRYVTLWVIYSTIQVESWEFLVCQERDEKRPGQIQLLE